MMAIKQELEDQYSILDIGLDWINLPQEKREFFELEKNNYRLFLTSQIYFFRRRKKSKNLEDISVFECRYNNIYKT